MADKKPSPKLVEKESDLDDLIIGDWVKVSLGDGNFKWLVYEGQIEGKDAFMDRNEIHGGIMSWRSERINLRFSGYVHFHSYFLHHKHYEEGSDEYNEKLPLLEEADL